MKAGRSPSARLTVILVTIIALATPGLPGGYARPARAATYTVCTAGPPACDYGSIQSAVDAAGDGDVIKVAAGLYSGVSGRPAPPSYLGPAVITQVVYLSKTLTIRGGYTTSNGFAEPPDPIAYPTTLDAQGQGRVLLITGAISPAIEGLRFTGGYALGLAGGYDGMDVGGGIYLFTATATISNNWVFSNTAPYYGGGMFTFYSDATIANNDFSLNAAGWGGAIFMTDSPLAVRDNTFSGNLVVRAGGALNVHESDATIIGNTISANEALYGGGLRMYASAAFFADNTVSFNTSSGYGGGMHLWDSPATLVGNVISDNTAGGDSGGVEFWNSAATLGGNTISGNSAAGKGGGLHLLNSPAVLRGNTISGNSTAGYGGGLHLEGSPATLDGNTISANEGVAGCGLYLAQSDATLESNQVLSNTGLYGGGLYLYQSDATLVNNLIADNQAQFLGSGLYLYETGPTLLHNTIARNHGGDGYGLRLTNGSTASLSNTILVSHTVGIYAESGTSAVLEGTLWGGGPWGNETDWGGDGTILTGTVNLWGDPAFVCTGGACPAPYRLTPASAAIDTAVEAGVDADIDGDPRPDGTGYDIGADEFPFGMYVTKVSDRYLVAAGTALTYTLGITNTGATTLTAMITDVLPLYVTPTGVLTWTIELAEGAQWTQPLVVTVEPGYAGLLDNVVQAAGDGATVSYTCTVTVEDPITGLQASSDSPTVLGQPTALTATVATGSNVDYAWAFGDGWSGAGPIVTHTYAATGIYTALVTASNSLSALTTTTTVTVTHEPIAGLQASNDSPTELGNSTTLTATITAGSNVTFTWAFGDGEYGSGAIVTHAYANAGTFTAAVTASNSVSTMTATTVVRITGPAYSIYLPLVMRNE